MTWGELRPLIENKSMRLTFVQNNEDIGYLDMENDIYDHLIIESLFFNSNYCCSKVFVKVVN